jgi:hypothetical protein
MPDEFENTGQLRLTIIENRNTILRRVGGIRRKSDFAPALRRGESGTARKKTFESG